MVLPFAQSSHIENQPRQPRTSLDDGIQLSPVHHFPRVTLYIGTPTVLMPSTNQTEEPRICRYRTESDRSGQPPRAFRRAASGPRARCDRAIEHCY